MANIRDLKKDINHVLGEIIEMAMDWKKANPDGDRKASAAIVDEAIATFDAFSARIYQKDIKDKRAHYRSLVNDLEAKGNELLAKLNAL